MQPQTPGSNTWMTLPSILFYLGIFAQLAFLAVIFWSSKSDGSHHISKPVAQAVAPQDLNPHDFTLRHIYHHGARQEGPRARRLDISAQRFMAAGVGAGLGPFVVKTSPVKIEKPPSHLYDAQALMSPIWVAENVEGPNVEDKETVVNFAYMAENSYHAGIDDPEWLDVGEKFNSSLPFGWDDSGIRGHIFANARNSTIILSLKGTTVAMFEGNGTSGHDKDNDNLFGSCCCGQGGSYMWRTVCDCKTGTYTCDDQCVRKELRRPNKYYEATVELYDEVIQLYPHARILTTGHSLGGVLASLIGLQRGIPSVTFEAYPQALAAKRLGFPTARDVAPLRKHTGGFHFGHTADPVYMGTCSSLNSFCSLAGYAFETQCHTGRRCAYDVVKDWGWRQSTQTHSLRYAIDKVYKIYPDAAKCEDEDVGCVDCFLWKYENGTKSTTTTAPTATRTSFTRTRTQTCKTPGWWGCRDKTPTGTATTPSSTATSASTKTCHTPGWFGCKDKTSTLTATTTTSTTTTTTTSCTTKGWFGRCIDEMPVTSISASERHAGWRTATIARQTVV